MNVAELLEKHRPAWQELEDILARLTRVFGRSRATEAEIARFTQLYRAACANLALAESYKLPPGIIRYLNNLVGRAHNQLYCDQAIGWSALPRLLWEELPRRIFSDGSFWCGMLLFWVPFLACAWLAYQYSDDGFAERIVGSGTLNRMEEMYSVSFGAMTLEERMPMLGFYIINNAGIGLQCFAAGAFFMVTGILITLFNAIYLGAIFGHMATTDVSGNFYEFVVAHGPFELTAIAMASGAGLRIGFALIATGGYDRIGSMKRAAKHAFPIILFAVFLFCCAACIEAFISPNPLEVLQMAGIDPVHFKRGICVLTAAMLFSYIVILGGVQWLRHIPER
jgi:uncharacterized membrane protein SpoIIM required for sporulation